MWFFHRLEKARFPRENGKNARVTLISHVLISVTLALTEFLSYGKQPSKMPFTAGFWWTGDRNSRKKTTPITM
jgi:hypothetical protein